MQQASSTLTYVPRVVLHLENEDARTCCAVAQCFGLCYLCDLWFTIPTMREFEEGLNRRSLPLFAFYELCWPCMWISICCCGMSPSHARELPWEYVPGLKDLTFDVENDLLADRLDCQI